MIKQRVLISALIFGFIFESASARAFGFYLAPGMLTAVLFSLLPFSLLLLNLSLAWFFGVGVFWLWAIVLNHGAGLSLKFIGHIAVYVSLLLAFIYIAYGAEKK